MHWTVSATTPDNRLRFHEDVTGEDQLTTAIARIQELATENNWLTEEQFAAEIEESLWEIIPRLRVGTLPTNPPLDPNTPTSEHLEIDGEWYSRHGEPQ